MRSYAEKDSRGFSSMLWVENHMCYPNILRRHCVVMKDPSTYPFKWGSVLSDSYGEPESTGLVNSLLLALRHQLISQQPQQQHLWSGYEYQLARDNPSSRLNNRHQDD